MVTILQNFVKLACLEFAFLKIGFFGILVYDLQTSQVMSKKFSDLTSGKNFMVIRPVVSEILGGGTTPQMPVHCQKEQMLLTVNHMSWIET